VKAEKEEKRVKGAEEIRRWVEKRTAEEVKQHRAEADRKKKEAELKELKKADDTAKAGKVFEVSLYFNSPPFFVFIYKYKL